MSQFAVLDALDSACWVIETDGRVVYANPAANLLCPAIEFLDSSQVQQLVSALDTCWRHQPLDSFLHDNDTASAVQMQLRIDRFDESARQCLQMRPLDSPSADRTNVLAEMLDALPQRLFYEKADGRILWELSELTTATDLRLGRIQPSALDTARAAPPSHSQFVSQLIPVQSAAGTRFLVRCSDPAKPDLESRRAVARTAVLESIARADPLPATLKELLRHLRQLTGATSCVIMLAGPGDNPHESDCGTISSPSGKIVGSLVAYYRTMPVENLYQELFNNVALTAGIAIERAETDRKLRAVNAELEERVAERTRELTDSMRELETARNEAEQATTAKSRFLAAATHDLRQPLQALILYLSALQHNTSKDQIDSIASKVSSAVSAMNDTLESLLDITSLANGQIDAQRSSIELSGLMSRLAAVHAPRAEAAGLDFSIDTANFHILSHDALLYRILDNLMANAISYTRSGQVRVRCCVEAEMLKIEVSDTGIGIPQSQQQRVFEEYVQLSNPGRNRKLGMGLGLAVVAQLCKLLDHDLLLDSKPGSGSTFTVCATITEPDLHQTIPAPLAPTPPRSGINPCVLFVDDDDDIVDAMKRVLPQLGYQLQTCFSGEQALSILGNGLEPDILITDYRLPDIAGTELTQKARHIIGDSLPAIIITGDAETLRKGIRLNSVDVLNKPVNTDELQRLIDDRIAVT